MRDPVVTQTQSLQLKRLVPSIFDTDTLLLVWTNVWCQASPTLPYGPGQLFHIYIYVCTFFVGIIYITYADLGFAFNYNVINHNISKIRELQHYSYFPLRSNCFNKMYGIPVCIFTLDYKLVPVICYVPQSISTSTQNKNNQFYFFNIFVFLYEEPIDLEC